MFDWVLNTPLAFTISFFQTFRFFDKDNDGSISKSELKQVMQKFGELLSEEEIVAMIEEADIDGDGEVTYLGTSCVTELDTFTRNHLNWLSLHIGVNKGGPGKNDI